MISVVTFRLPLEDDKMPPLLKEPQKSGRMGHHDGDNFVTGQPRSLTDIDGRISPEQICDATSLNKSKSSNRVVATHVEYGGQRVQLFDSGTGIWKYLLFDARRVLRVEIEQRVVNGAEGLIL